MFKTLTPFLLLGTSALLFFFVINPQYMKIKETSAEYSVYNDTLNETNSLLNKRDDLLKKKQSISARDLARLEKMLPSAVDNVRLVLDLNGIASTHRISLKNIQVDSGSTKTPGTIAVASSLYGTVPLKFSFSASYPTFLSFIEDLEKSLRIVDVTSLAVRAAKADSYDFDIALKTYWLK